MQNQCAGQTPSARRTNVLGHLSYLSFRTAEYSALRQVKSMLTNPK
jgi:hypothetical protein